MAGEGPENRSVPAVFATSAPFGHRAGPRVAILRPSRVSGIARRYERTANSP